VAVDGAGWGLQGVLLLHAVEQGLPAQVDDSPVSTTFLSGFHWISAI
jgi:hypothetical protein